jgi:hypothetical protein
MKTQKSTTIKLSLYSNFFSEEDIEKLDENFITTNWECDFLPRKGETILLDNLELEGNNLDYDILSLSWEITNVVWSKTEKGTIPEFILKGE